MLFGVGEGVNVTNVTSKKPGDFQELFRRNLHVYEVTTKKVDEQRLVESSNAVADFVAHQEIGPSTVDITFLCRMGDVLLPNAQPSNGRAVLFTTSYNGYDFALVDIWLWIENMLERIGSEGRAKVLDGIQTYVEQPNTHLDVKAAWRELSKQSGAALQT
jgi:hypothetical protein